MDARSLAREAYRLLATRPSGLLSDIDGTLSQIANDPGAVFVEPQIKASLINLVSHFDVMGVVTGRSAVEAVRLVDIDGVLHFGNHGMERIDNGQVVASKAALQYAAPLKRVMDIARSEITDQLIMFENKGISGSVHYRNANDPALAREAVQHVLTPLANREGLRLTQGRMVIEIRPPLDINKGTALQEVVSEYKLCSIIFMGDDVTDVDAMRAVTALRADGKLQGLSIGVVGPETPDIVTEVSDYVVNGVEGVADFLAELVELVTHLPGQRDRDEAAG